MSMTAGAGKPDELDEYIAEQMRDPEFARWWHRISAATPLKLPVDGHEYHRRRKARRRRGRRTTPR